VCSTGRFIDQIFVATAGKIVRIRAIARVLRQWMDLGFVLKRRN
jgi:hypothetical protein